MTLFYIILVFIIQTLVYYSAAPEVAYMREEKFIHATLIRTLAHTLWLVSLVLGLKLLMSGYPIVLLSFASGMFIGDLICSIHIDKLK